MGTREQFLRALFEKAVQAGKLIEIRDIVPGKQVFPKFYRDIESVVNYAYKGNCYIGVCPREIESGTEENIKTITALWVDLDIPVAEAMEKLKEFPLQPSITVNSGRNTHLYWLLKDPESVQSNTKGILKGLAQTLGADHCFDLPRVLRLPGTKNFKDLNNPKDVEMVAFEPDIQYTLSDFSSYEVEIPKKNEQPAFFSNETPEICLENLEISGGTLELILHGKRDGDKYPSRSEADYKVVCDLVKGGCSDDVIKAIFDSYPIGSKYREQDERYLKRTIENARKDVAAQDALLKSYEVMADDPKAVPDAARTDRELPSFTLDLFPEGLLRDYVEFAYPLTEAPIQYHMAVGLIMVASILGRNVFLEEGAATFYPNLYMLVIGESGITRKSTALRMVNKFIPYINPDLIMGTNLSLEGFIEAFRDHPYRLMIYDEIKHLLVNDSKPYGAGLISAITAVWDNPPFYRIELKSLDHDQKTIQTPTLNFIAASTRDWFNVSESDIRGGFLGRFVPILSGGEDRILAIMPDIDRQAQERLLNRLKDLQFINRQYSWHPDARTVFEEHYRRLRREFKDLDNKVNIQPYWSRIDTNLRKLSMIFDVCSPDPAFQITLNNLQYAIRFMDNVTKYYRLMLESLTFSKMERKEQDFLNKLEASGGSCDHSKIMKDIHLDADMMKKVVASLLEKDLIKASSIPSGKKGKTIYSLKKED